MKKLLSAAVVAIGFGVTPYVHAHYVASEPGDSSNSGVLSTRENRNSELESGTYEFAQVHAKPGKSFTDYWGFSLDTDSAVSISIFDLEVGLNSGWQQLGEQEGSPYGKQYGHGNKRENSTHWATGGKLLDNKFLSLSLFDEDGNLLGSTGENGTLSNLALAGGEWYTLSISAAVKGMFGSVYQGSLTVAPSAVPLGDSLPFFASALGLLGLRYRKRLQLKR